MPDLSKLILAIQNDTAARLVVRFFYFAQRRLKSIPVVPRREIDGSTEELLGFYERVAYWNMTMDPVRTEAYRQAAVCFEGLRTIDLGTGAHAPQAKLALDGGATHVDAIEAKAETAAAARDFLAQPENDWSQNVTLWEGLSFDVDLPTRAEGLVHEIVGTVGSDEGFPICVADAQERLLVPEATIVPQCVQTWMIPIGEIRPGLLSRVLSGMLVGASRPETTPGVQLIYNPPRSTWLAEEPQLMESFTTGPGEPPMKAQLEQTRSLTFRCVRAGRFTGFLLGCRVITRPGAPVVDALTSITSWGNACVRMSEEPRDVREGETLAVEVSVDARKFIPRYQIDVRFEDGEAWSTTWRGPAISPVKDDAVEDSSGDASPTT